MKIIPGLWGHPLLERRTPAWKPGRFLIHALKCALALLWAIGLLAGCQTLPEKTKPKQPQSAEEFKTFLNLTESQYLRVEPILSRFLSGQKELREKSKSEDGDSGKLSEGVRAKVERLAQLTAQELKPYLTPEQLSEFEEITRLQGAKSGGRGGGGGHHSGSGGMGHAGEGNMGF